LKTRAFILAICFCFANCIAQDNNEVLSHIPKTGKSPKEFIPKGYDTLWVANGDMNKDGISDRAMVLKDVREDTAAMGSDINGANRLLVVLFKTSTGWELAAESADIIMCKACGGVFGDPFALMGITNGVLTIDHYGGSAWRWSYTHKFRYQNGDFFLVGKTRNSFWDVKNCEDLGEMAGTDYEDINFVTGSRERKKISEDCKLLLDKKDKIAIKPLLKLSAVKAEE
jgi:hypothetical protein